ncbi:MAG: hypothetical protein ACK5W9_07005 [Bdellovibrionales bacterium]
MESKIAKNTLKINQRAKSVRINSEIQKKAERILLLANKKKVGRRVKIDHLLSLAIDLVSEEDIKKLQNQSLTNEDRKEILRQKWVALNGPISKDEFTGFMMTEEYFNFVSEHKLGADSSILSRAV